MKFIKSHILLVLLGLFALTSCEDYFGDINTDPDNPLEVTPGALLPQVQLRLAYTLGGDASRYTSIYTQHVDGVSRQFVVFQNYNITPSDVDQLWDNLYTGIMADNRQLLRLAEAGGYNHYIGVSKAIEAYTLLLTTDLWGDIPYSEAFQGTELLQPRFDAQQEVYNSVFTLIDESRSAFDADGGALVPGGDDLIYGGDLVQWRKFLDMLEARALLHLGEVDNANYNAALGAITKAGLTGRSDDARVMFGNPSTENAPWYQYIQQRDDIEVGDSYVAMLEELNDPRAAVFGALLDLPHPYFAANRDFPILTYTEAKFIEAETQFRVNGAAAAHDAYLEAIRSSMADAGITDETAINDYLAQASVDPGEGNLTLELIMEQKYLSLFTDPEVYNDWRRAGIPDLDPNTGTQIPLRLPYPQTEGDSNDNMPSRSQITPFTPVWWDK